MFGTLVVLLPSGYRGGALVVRHQGEHRRFDFAADNEHTLCWAAFYADCEHEIERVSSGRRLCLIYNLVHSRGDRPPALPANEASLERIIACSQAWAADEDGPEKLLYVLDHKYSPAGLSFRGLKGRDRAVVQLLRQARSAGGFDLALCILARDQSGSAVATRRWRPDWEMEEVYDTSTYLTDVTRLDDVRDPPCRLTFRRPPSRPKRRCCKATTPSMRPVRTKSRSKRLPATKAPRWSDSIAWQPSFSGAESSQT